MSLEKKEKPVPTMVVTEPSYRPQIGLGRKAWSAQAKESRPFVKQGLQSAVS